MNWMDAGIAGGTTYRWRSLMAEAGSRPREERCPQTRHRNAIACPDPTDAPKNRAPFAMFETLGNMKLDNLNHMFLYC